MKTAIFNFLVLQVVIWAFVFSGNMGSQSSEVNYALISDSWEVANIGQDNENDVVLHYPSFNQLTLNLDGTYLRIGSDETIERGRWAIDSEKSLLTLSNDNESKSFDIIQLPNSDKESFIIKENAKHLSSNMDLQYELIRI